ncbi:Uu.00g059160.m01.CDS01 [Anthostomella pinea]|uniref:Uu.00g059160.m01.CDS01 n=1 Tax=Anthostomella pinea TaxID=933095 RepID=A0AAI8VRY3_9PEZI|nr:Uu.00g059160.m01.CDS01 [Anthostomella pinea]
MAALVQTYPQQSGTVTLLQARPNSASGIMPTTSQAHPGQAYMANPQRTSYHGLPGSVGGQSAYRGSSIAPVQPYAFTSTPNLTNGGQWQQYGGYRTSSGTTVPTMQQMVDARGQPAPVPASRPQLNGTSNQPTFAQVAAAKASPERYRRPSPRHTETSPAGLQSSQPSQGQGSATPSGSGMATVVHLYNPRAVPDRKAAIPRNPAVLPRPHSAYGTGVTMDDMHLHRQVTDEEAKRFRRRSIHSINSSDYPTPLTPQDFKQAEESFRLEAPAKSNKQSNVEKSQKPAVRVVPAPPPATNVEKSTIPARNGSSESLVSSRSSNSRPSSSANRNSNASAPTGSPASTSSTSGEKPSSHDQLKLVNIPPRGSSSDVGKRVLSPSPLSKPVTMGPTSSSGETAPPAGASVPSPTKPPTSSHGSKADSPAAKHLAAINDKGAGGKLKSKSSRLRRAFSFGSAAELRKATGQDISVDAAKTSPNEPARLHKDPRPQDVYEEEQARIAQKQEEGGIGSSIYSGTKLFSGSTDNLSISSTASSASIMLRKMGRGVKKGSRSLVGIFRPKSVIVAPGEDLTAPQASQAAVTMVTVEAERDRVNVTTNEDLQETGGTGFPHLERNSIDATKAADSVQPDRLGSSGTDHSGARKSMVGGEKERAEVLATIRKGILKTRSNSPSPSTRGQDSKGPTFELPLIPNVADSPNSTAPSTPNDDVQGHKRNGSIAIGNEDYFMSALRLRQDTKSAPTTPAGGISKRNATFSPRIVFHDTWTPGEYDRRGEIATCNRLTPMLAQQIKEELNSFKMEMEVHETSKIYTHFF